MLDKIWVFFSFRFGVDMGQFSRINRIMTELNQLEAFTATHPDKQPDCPIK